jgi:V/A-type H+-transporting ATPase subunit E
MSCRELIESLRRAGDDKVRNLWEEAEAEAGRIRVEVADRIARLRADSESVQSAKAGAAIAVAVSEANNRVRARKLSAEKVLSSRLFIAAVASLQRLRDDGYPALFETLARELPLLRWRLVSVHPADIELAKRHFPGAEITADEKITGGMDATAEGGLIRVVNTFEKRLERTWADMLPLLIKDVYQEVSDGIPAKS